MTGNDDVATVRNWLTAIDERRFEDALDLVGEGWIDHGPDGFAFGRDEFLATAGQMIGKSGLRLTIHGQVSTGGYVATSLSWTDGSQRMDVVRLDLIRNGKVVDSHFSTDADIG